MTAARTRANPVYRRSAAASRVLKRMGKSEPYTIFGPGDLPALPELARLPADCWGLFGIDGTSGAYNDEVDAELEKRGIQLADSGGLALEPQQDDSLGCFDSDEDAILMALHSGLSLVKVPDEPGSRYYRWHVVEPIPAGHLQGSQHGLPRVANPSDPAVLAGLYGVAGAVGGGMLGTAVTAPLALTGIGVLFVPIGALFGSIAGTRWAVGKVDGLSAKDMREAKNYATFGAVIFPPLGAGLGAAIGAADNPVENPGGLTDNQAFVLETLAAAIVESGPDATHAFYDTGWGPEVNVMEYDGLVYRVDSGPGYSVVAATDEGLQRLADHTARMSNPKDFKLWVNTASGFGRQIDAKRVSRDFAVHPSLRNLQEIQRGEEGKAKTYALTHIPTGALVATLGNKSWAKKLGRELQQISYSPGVRSSDLLVAQTAIAGPDQRNLPYILDMVRTSHLSKANRGDFPIYDAWVRTSAARAANPGQDLKVAAAVSAGLGSLLGGILGGFIGGISVGVVATAFGYGLAGPAGLPLAGFGILGIPIGGMVGTIWGAVRQTDRALAGHDATDAKIGAGIGAFFSPIGAAVGGYLGAPE